MAHRLLGQRTDVGEGDVKLLAGGGVNLSQIVFHVVARGERDCAGPGGGGRSGGRFLLGTSGKGEKCQGERGEEELELQGHAAKGRGSPFFANRLRISSAAFTITYAAHRVFNTPNLILSW